MAFLDFVRNRQETQKQPVGGKSPEQKPETAKEMGTRIAAEDKVNATRRDQMPPEQQAKLEQIKATLAKSTHHSESNASAPAAARADDGTKGAYLQKQSQQDKTQAALSPTDGAAGKSAAQGQERAPQKAEPQKPQTTPRSRPSWER